MSNWSQTQLLFQTCFVSWSNPFSFKQQLHTSMSECHSDGTVTLLIGHDKIKVWNASFSEQLEQTLAWLHKAGCIQRRREKTIVLKG